MIKCLVCGKDLTDVKDYYVHKRPQFNEEDPANICLECVDKLIEVEDE